MIPRLDQPQSNKTQVSTESNNPLDGAVLPEGSGAWRNAAILALGLALGSTVGCAPARPASIKEQDLIVLKAVGEQYQKTYPSDGSAGGLLYLAHLISGRPMEDLNQEYRSTSGYSQAGSAHQVLLSAMANKPISEISDAFSKTTSSGAYVCNNLVLASLISNSSIAEVNAVFKSTSPWISEANAMLTLAQSISKQPVTVINDLYSKSNPSTSAGAFLVLTSILTKQPIEELNQIFDRSEVWNDKTGAQLTALSVIHNKTIEEVYGLYSQCTLNRVAAVNLVQAALISGRTMEEINYLYSQSDAKSSDGGALIVLGNVLKESSASSKQLRCLPLLVSQSAGRTTATMAFPLILPKGVAEGVGYPIAR